MANQTVSEETLSPAAREVAARFANLGSEQNRRFFLELAEYYSSVRDSDSLPMHFEYGITANERGRALADRIAPHLEPRRGLRKWRRPRMLDVGCAYGGFLVAFGKRGFRVVGIEKNPLLVRLAQTNLEENGVSADLVLGDATAEHPRFRGRFDVIVANDVVEHVRRLEEFLGNIRGWLTPRGAAYFEIPNGACPAFVLRDGHHQLFAIALLGFDEASAYYKERVPYGEYDTYNYMNLDGYRRVFADCGLSFEVLPETLDGVTPEGTDAQVTGLCTEANSGLATVPENLRRLVRTSLANYLSRLEAAPRGSEEDRRRFLLDYGASFWRVLARRSE
jgi:2-polyprenyl-3-methyl-5-hydroxy-6-metoxy-1,4-benzoquinol methylase